MALVTTVPSGLSRIFKFLRGDALCFRYFPLIYTTTGKRVYPEIHPPLDSLSLKALELKVFFYAEKQHFALFKKKVDLDCAR